MADNFTTADLIYGMYLSTFDLEDVFPALMRWYQEEREFSGRVSAQAAVAAAAGPK